MANRQMGRRVKNNSQIKKSQKDKNDEAIVDLRRHIKTGVVRKGNDIFGVWFMLPVKPMSINEYTKLHFSEIAKYRRRYKSIFDVCMCSLFNHNNFRIVDTGVVFDKPVFDKVELSWVLSFNLPRLRDISNYVQKVMLDALVDTGIVKDDNHLVVIKDTTQINVNKESLDSILLYMFGDFDQTRLQAPITKQSKEI